MAELKVNVEEELLYSVSEIIYCRICHEGEFESCKTLETPCSCSGTIKVFLLLCLDYHFSFSLLGITYSYEFNLCFEFWLIITSHQFAHRDCVQRWCDEKGNTNCELCLQVRFLHSFFIFFFFLKFWSWIYGGFVCCRFG